MPREVSRPRRVADQIQRELGELIVREVADPRLAGVLVSGVEVSRDLVHAKVFVTLQDSADAAQTLSVLRRATGFLRHKLAQRLRIRALPQLRFVHDPTLDTANRIDALLDRALAADQRAGPDAPGERVDLEED